MTLEYLRETCIWRALQNIWTKEKVRGTYFHIANNYGLRENTCYRNIIWIEDNLVKSKEFSLPKRKELLEDNNDIEVILVDATEPKVLI